MVVAIIVAALPDLMRQRKKMGDNTKVHSIEKLQNERDIMVAEWTPRVTKSGK